MTVLDLCAYLGLAAVGTATANMVLGLLIALRYSPVRLWPRRRLNIFRLHNWTAYFVLLLIGLHPAVEHRNAYPRARKAGEAGIGKCCRDPRTVAGVAFSIPADAAIRREAADVRLGR